MIDAQNNVQTSNWWQTMDYPVFQLNGHRDSVNVLQTDAIHNPNMLASGSDDGTCRLWDLRTHRVDQCLNIKMAIGLGNCRDAQLLESAAVHSLAFGNCNDPYMLHVGAGNKVLTFDMRNKALIVTEACKEILVENSEEVNTIHVHPGKNRNYLSAPDDSGAIKIYDLNTHSLYKSLQYQHENICSTAPFRPNSSWDVISGGLDGLILFWDLNRGRIKYKLDLQSIAESPSHSEDDTMSESTNQLFNPPLVHSLAFAPDGKTFAAALGDTTVAIIDYCSRNFIKKLKAHQAAVSQVLFRQSTDSQLLISCGNDRRICMWDYNHILSLDKSKESMKAQIFLENSPNCIASNTQHNIIVVADPTAKITAYAMR